MDERGLVPAQVLYVGVAQEKQRVFRTIKRRNPVTGATYPWLVAASGVVNQYYFYCVDEEWTPTGFVDTIRSGTMVYEERTGSGTGSQEVHPGV